MRADGILTFTANARDSLHGQTRDLLERQLGPEEDLIFLDYATLKGRIVRRPALLALTSQRFMILRHDLFAVEMLFSIPWWDIDSIRLLPLTKSGFFNAGTRLAELDYTDAGEGKQLVFGVGRPGSPDKTEALVRNMSLRFRSADVAIYVAADTLIFYQQGQASHVRLRRWIFDAILDNGHPGVAVLLTNEAILRQRLHNLLYVDFSGDVQWRGELPTSKGVPDSFLRVEVNNGDIIGHTWSGFVCHLERETGRLTKLQRIVSPGKNQGDLETTTKDGKHKATLILAGEDRLGNRLYRLFIESSYLFKERLFGGQAHWSPDGRYLAVQEYYLSRLQGIQSVGVVVFDLLENQEALIEKSVSRNFGPQGWKSSETLLYGQGLGRDSNPEEISLRRVFWLPLKNGGLEAY